MCGADRVNGTGACGSGARVRIARAALHYGEEPCVSGTEGSGTVFFSGCSLRCVFCQNMEISRGGFGEDISVRRLAEIFRELEEQGANNLNLNPNSLTVLKECYLEPNFSDAKAFDSYQFVRNGFFCVDYKDSTPEHLVFNRIVSLKSSFKLPKA